MKKLVVLLLMSVFVSGAFTLFIQTDDPVKTETVKKPLVDLATAEFAEAPEAVSVEYAVYYPPMIEEDATNGTLPRPVAKSPPETITIEYDLYYNPEDGGEPILVNFAKHIKPLDLDRNYGKHCIRAHT